jgi:hypothetical protein
VFSVCVVVVDAVAVVPSALLLLLSSSLLSLFVVVVVVVVDAVDVVVVVDVVWGLQVISTNNDTVIRSVVVFSLETGLFEGESLVQFPAAPVNTIRIPIRPPKNTAAELRLQVPCSLRSLID